MNADDPDAGLNSLGGHVFETALRRDAQDDFGSILEQPDRAPATQSQAGL